ncbi:hypothetical protein ACFLYB_04525 [Chloroflexota bacterium]
MKEIEAGKITAAVAECAKRLTLSWAMKCSRRLKRPTGLKDMIDEGGHSPQVSRLLSPAMPTALTCLPQAEPTMEERCFNAKQRLYLL